MEAAQIHIANVRTANAIPANANPACHALAAVTAMKRRTEKSGTYMVPLFCLVVTWSSYLHPVKRRIHRIHVPLVHSLTAEL